ncbi:putative ATPase/DNA-binding SARP family transcriptional activator [Actinomadura luteofluorescens]|uniref:Putative ATPase/DNA-binding SARP family transcriptional activator n=1 Tax=Actinomadura luteofluorescens TaxID=46163 RepID=A0A7Y9EGE2_9ACTN|nr:BTAD domain-containing putative transcriptional regulator [Actinomadura luteofluorescens]NYD47261.1 putative ATPase/DNA-binding SARP family transcriptional activator [Actinomadura luteofluorescens]
MRFGVLGPLMVRDGEGAPVRIPEAKVRALLADLLVHEGRPVSADRLVHDLWGDDLPGNPANALQAKVSQLRRALGRDRVVREAHGYRLRLDGPGDEVDADRFRALAARARTLDAPRERAALLTEALGLWRGPALADFADEEFARAAADRLADQRLAVLEEQAEARLDAGEHLLLAGELADLVARHPLRERLRAVQMRALYRAGRQGEALAAYTELRKLLADDLGLDPSPELAALHEAILRQDASLAPPERASRSNLPASLTELVGRDRCLDDVRRLVAGPARLVTLTGPGGVGKTRLALEAAARLAGDAFPDGVRLVELAGQRGDAAALAQEISAVLGLRDDVPPGVPAAGTSGGGGGSVERLAAALRDRRMLLVLDNCEQVVDPAAALVERLLRGAAGLRILATGREPLGLTGETVYLVEPLREDDAVRLFADRAAASAPGFSLDADRAAVAEICRRLDGVPLALELAATRVRALGARELARRLTDRFGVLTTGPRGAPARQRTLRGMIDWSWEPLGPSERAVLRRLAVHADGCGLGAAEAVCAGGDVRGEDVLDLLTRLVDRSLVVMVDGPRGPRYRLLESVAAYAMERLREAGDLDGTRDRHLRHHLDLAERAEPHLRGPEQQAWLDRLDADSANLRVALEEALRRPGAAEAVRLGTALCWWWLLRGRLHEAHRTLSAVLDAAPGATELRLLRAAFALLTGDRTALVAQGGDGIPDPVRRGRALWLYAHGLYHAGDPDASERANEDALRLFQEAGDRWGTAAALGLRATLALVRGRLDVIADAGGRAAALFTELGDRWGRLQPVSPLAMLAEINGDYAAAERLQREGLRIAEELDLRAEVSARLSGLGRLALLARDWDRARDLHERARSMAVEQGYRFSETHALMGLALGARRSGDLDTAREILHRIRDEYDSSEIGEHLLRAELGFTAELRGDAAEALAHHTRGLEIARSIGEPRALALSLEGLAGAAALAGDAMRAAELLGQADAARRSVNAPLPPAERGDVDRITSTATAALGQRAFTEAFQRGAQTIS